jgi:hypothetical protein
MSALTDARRDFAHVKSCATASDYLDAAIDAWNEEELSERDLVGEVRAVQFWLSSEAEARGLRRATPRAASPQS